ATVIAATVGDGSGNEVQTVTVGGTGLSGTFTLTFAGQTTGTNTPTDTAGTPPCSQQALSTIGSGNVTVLGASTTASGGTYLVVFTGALASANVPQITVGTNSLTGTTPTLTLATQADGVGNEVQTVVLGGTSLGGTYTLTFAGQTTGNINPTD